MAAPPRTAHTASTEQIFHVDAFLSREAPAAVVLPDNAAGLTLERQDTFEAHRELSCALDQFAQRLQRGVPTLRDRVVLALVSDPAGLNQLGQVLEHRQLHLLALGDALRSDDPEARRTVLEALVRAPGPASLTELMQ